MNDMQLPILYAFEIKPADDVQALFQIPKHRRDKEENPLLTTSSRGVGVSFGLFNPHILTRGRVVVS